MGLRLVDMVRPVQMIVQFLKLIYDPQLWSINLTRKSQTEFPVSEVWIRGGIYDLSFLLWPVNAAHIFQFSAVLNFWISKVLQMHLDMQFPSTLNTFLNVVGLVQWMQKLAMNTVHTCQVNLQCTKLWFTDAQVASAAHYPTLLFQIFLR